MGPHFRSVQFCKYPRTQAVGGLKKTRSCFVWGLHRGASCGPLSDLPWGARTLSGSKLDLPQAFGYMRSTSGETPQAAAGLLRGEARSGHSKSKEEHN